MICSHKTTRNYLKRKFSYCRLRKKEISFDDCKKCPDFEFRKYKPLKKQSKKLKKLEQERDKGRIKKGFCQACGKFSKRLDPHEIYGGSNRQRSIKNGFVADICRICHEDEEKLKKLKIDKQIEFEKTHTREEFIKIIGKSYL